MKASMFDHPSVVQLLLDRNARVDEREKVYLYLARYVFAVCNRIQWQYGCTSLMFAARQGNTEVVQVLLRNGADVNIKNYVREYML